MTEKEKRPQKNFQALMSVMTEAEQDNVLCFLEGMTAMANQLRAPVGA